MEMIKIDGFCDGFSGVFFMKNHKNDKIWETKNVQIRHSIRLLSITFQFERELLFHKYKIITQTVKITPNCKKQNKPKK